MWLSFLPGGRTLANAGTVNGQLANCFVLPFEDNIEEIFEVITWAQLSFHDKPCGFLNINGYYDHLIKFIDHSLEENFIVPEHRAMILIDDDPKTLLDKFSKYEPPIFDKAKWILGMMPKEERDELNKKNNVNRYEYLVL